MAFDYKKEYKDLYQPKTMPAIVMVPAMRFVAVDGVGDPNEEGGDYAKAMQLLYGISFTVKMSKKSKNPAEHIDGYFDYTVPPLEGLWSMGVLWAEQYPRKALSIIHNYFNMHRPVDGIKYNR